MNLSTTYLGLQLKNPIVVASSGLTKNVDNIKKCEQTGAGAVVMKSLFEEQIRAEGTAVAGSTMMHPEAYEYVRAELEMQYGPREYAKTLSEAKKSVSIPIIASINCHSDKWWLNYAKQLQDAGADALELNVYVLPFDGTKSGAEIENMYLQVLKAVLAQVSIPVSIKLSPYFTSFGNFAKQLDRNGAKGLVLFNRFIQPDINLKDMTPNVKAAFDDPIGFMHALRWVALLSDKVALDLAASGNIRTADDVIKQILAGAAVVQVASVLYKEGMNAIQTMCDGIEAWMKTKGYDSIADYYGKLSTTGDAKDESFIRAQFIKTMTGIE
ncbi:dihydroorotate dehydrogenase-like protein [candidate division KSB1 bacterium]|nr:dihydroorotate dehydrogenase-like protein [candidate division KSB1 bacterium]